MGYYRYGFNGVEKIAELGDDHNTTFFREQDVSIGRWWSMDPKQTTGHSPYGLMGGNPILYSDVLGDTTRVYNLEGSLQHTFNDSLSNEEHFLRTGALSDVGCENDACGAAGGNNENYLGGLARAMSEYYVGANTRNDLQKQAKIANAGDGNERGFLLFTTSKSKELRLADITDSATSRSKRNMIFHSIKIDAIKSSSSSYVGKGNRLRSAGYIHTLAGLKSNFGPQYRPKYNTAALINDPTNPDDYQDILNRSGIHSSFIGSSKGYTIFSSSRKTNTGNVYDYKGNLIISKVEGL